MEFIFATSNAHKLKEVSALAPSSIRLKSLAEMGFAEEIEEPFETLEENAVHKARTIYEEYGLNCFSEDTGLEVTALNGEPGVFSARYAGEHGNAAKNMDKLLLKLRGVSDRSARFRTAIALILDGKCFTFEGSVWGSISSKPLGAEGFGYDPVFVPEGFESSFAQMSARGKNTLSHRKRAFEKLFKFLD